MSFSQRQVSSEYWYFGRENVCNRSVTVFWLSLWSDSTILLFWFYWLLCFEFILRGKSLLVINLRLLAIFLRFFFLRLLSLFLFRFFFFFFFFVFFFFLWILFGALFNHGIRRFFLCPFFFLLFLFGFLLQFVLFLFLFNVCAKLF